MTAFTVYYCRVIMRLRVIRQHPALCLPPPPNASKALHSVDREACYRAYHKELVLVRLNVTG
jgi:hypothetical protein